MLWRRTMRKPYSLSSARESVLRAGAISIGGRSSSRDSLWQKLQRTESPSTSSEYVFAQPAGAAGPYHDFDSHWYEALETAGISNFHFDDLRHTTASMLAAQGASLLEIAYVLGHKTLAMVKRYSHLVVDHKARSSKAGRSEGTMKTERSPERSAEGTVSPHRRLSRRAPYVCQ
jgi:integrase